MSILLNKMNIGPIVYLISLKIFKHENLIILVEINSALYCSLVKQKRLFDNTTNYAYLADIKYEMELKFIASIVNFDCV